MTDAKNDESTNTGGAGLNAPGHLVLGPGESRSLRERFNVDMATGGMSLRLPIKSTPGRSGFGPSLDLVYNSGLAGVNGVFGAGWSLHGVDSISRKTSVVIPVHDGNETEFVHSSAGDIVSVLEAIISRRGQLSCIRLSPSQFDHWEAPDTTNMTVEDFQLGLAGLNTSNAKRVDLNGDGPPRVLARVDGGWHYHSSDSGDKLALKAASQVYPIPLFAASNNWTLEDLLKQWLADFMVRSL
ncbi:hypothetical protein NUW58_g3128 [Xylaria curta]|uniref:Uncharacterized protein n=1 Tax=Xylaria curta TaxID=42375 RepID=A0ACC1PDC1_9PEZI|nr:hypothetical protein NUW58_g3128 [Xylaria curta]